jgi:hypothetical protein
MHDVESFLWSIRRKASECRRHAGQCIDMAASTSDFHSRVRLADLAAAWLRLADRIDSTASRANRPNRSGSAAARRSPVRRRSSAGAGRAADRPAAMVPASGK